MLTEEDFEAIDDTEDSPGGWETIKNVSRDIIDTHYDIAKLLFKGVSKAGISVAEGLESLGAEAASYIATGQRLTSEEQKELPIRSLKEYGKETLNNIEYTSTMGKAVFPYAEPIVQFSAAGAVGKAAKVGNLANTVISTGLGFSGEDSNAAELLKLIPSEYTKQISEVFENDPNSPEWDNRLMNIVADIAALPVFGAAAAAGSAAGKATARVGVKAISKLTPQIVKDLTDRTLVALRTAWRNHQTKKYVDGVKETIEQQKEIIDKTNKLKQQAKDIAMQEGKETVQKLEQHLPPGKNMEKESERVLKNIEEKTKIKRDDITLADMEKIKKSGAYETNYDESLAYDQLLKNTEKQMPETLKDIRSKESSGVISSEDANKLRYQVLNNANKEEVAWGASESEAGTSLMVKGKSEAAQARNQFREWFNKNVADMSPEQINTISQIIEEDGVNGYTNAINAIMKNKRYANGKISAVKDSYDIGRLVDNLHYTNQALRLTSSHQALSDLESTAANVLYTAPEMFATSVFSYAQKLKFKNADTAIKRGLNDISTYLFGAGELTDPVAFSEGLRYLKGTIGGYANNLFDNKLARKLLQKTGKKTNVMRIFENLPDDVSSLNPNRAQINFQRVSGERGIASGVNKAFDKIEKFGATVQNSREYVDSINQSSALNGILEARLSQLVKKNFPKEQQAQAFSEAVDRAIDMLPMARAKQAAFDNLYDSQIFSVVQDAYQKSLEITLRDPLQGFSQKLYNAFFNNKWGSRFVRIFEPFSKTRLTFWIDRVAMERTPLAKFTQKYKDAVSMGGRSAAEAKAKMWLGSSVIGYFAKQYYFDNKIDGGYTKSNLDSGLQADYSKNPAERAYEKSTNFVPYSKKVGNYQVKLDGLGIPGALISKALKTTQTLLYFMDRLDAKENVKYDDEGNIINPETQYGTLMTATMLAVGSAMSQGTYLEDFMDLIESIDEGNVEAVKRKTRNILPVPQLAGEMVTAASGIESLVDEDSDNLEYRQIMQANDDFVDYLKTSFGGETETERDFRGRPIKSYSPLMFIAGVKAKESYEPDDIDEEIVKEQAYVSEPNYNTTIQPESGLPSAQIVLSPKEVRDWKKIMNENTFILPNGKKAKGVDGALRDLINSSEYKAALEYRGTREKITDDQIILKSQSQTKRGMFRERYNYIKKQALLMLYQLNGDVRKKYIDSARSPNIQIPTMQIK